MLRAIQRAPLKTEAAVPRPTPRPDPIADLIAPAPRVIAVQRALNDFGYGPVKATGVYGAETIAAIQKFERDRKLPVTGSDLAAPDARTRRADRPAARVGGYTLPSHSVMSRACPGQ